MVPAAAARPLSSFTLPADAPLAGDASPREDDSGAAILELKAAGAWKAAAGDVAARGVAPLAEVGVALVCSSGLRRPSPMWTSMGSPSVALRPATRSSDVAAARGGARGATGEGGCSEGRGPSCEVAVALWRMVKSAAVPFEASAILASSLAPGVSTSVVGSGTADEVERCSTVAASREQWSALSHSVHVCDPGGAQTYAQRGRWAAGRGPPSAALGERRRRLARATGRGALERAPLFGWSAATAWCESQLSRRRGLCRSDSSAKRRLLSPQGRPLSLVHLTGMFTVLATLVSCTASPA